MKVTATIALIVATSAALYAEEASPQLLQSVPKNLARQHYGTNLFAFDGATQRFVATEAAAAWLDDDVATGWPALAGKQHYLLHLAEPQLVTNFALSARDSAGSVTIYTGEQASAPGDASWALAAKEVSIADLNHKKLGTPLNKTAKYLLIETNIPEPGPIYSLYLYGEKSAATESITKRAQPVDVRTVAGEFVNNQTSFNLSSIYGKALVTHANAGGGAGSWQRAIDDNPESFIGVKPSTTEGGLVVKLDSAHAVSRISILADPLTAGKVEVYVLPDVALGNAPVTVEGLTPAATLTFDGSAGRSSADVADVSGGTMVLRWTPTTAGTDLPLRELNTFGDLSLAEYEVSGLPPVIAQGPGSAGEGKEIVPPGDGKTLMPVGEGPETTDFKGGSGKEALPPVAAGPAGRGFRPGSLGFPPNFGRPVSP